MSDETAIRLCNAMNDLATTFRSSYELIDALNNLSRALSDFSLQSQAMQDAANTMHHAARSMNGAAVTISLASQRMR